MGSFGHSISNHVHSCHAGLLWSVLFVLVRASRVVWEYAQACRLLNMLNMLRVPQEGFVHEGDLPAHN